MKKLICLVISAVLFCTLCCTTALAVGAKYQNTKRFVQLLDEIDIRYTIGGVEDNAECVTVKNRDDKSSYTIFYYFDQDEEEVGLRVWNFIDFSNSDYNRVLRAVNDLNSRYKFITFCVDDTDNSVTAEMDLIVRNDSCAGDIVLEATLRMAQILEDAYDTLGEYAK